MTISAAALDRRIEILSVQQTRTAAGQVKDGVEVVVATVAAQRLELRLSDVNRAAGKQSVAAAKYRIRYRAGLTLDNRVRVDGKTYFISAIDEPDRRQSLLLTLEEAK